MKKYLLSICIPTYNRAHYLAQTLTNITHKLDERVEIVIGDGNSTDETEQVVRKFQRSNDNISYVKFNKKSGIDVDINKTVMLAKSEYCWLFSSDDFISEDGIAEVIKNLESKPDVILLNRRVCNFDMTKSKDTYWLKGNRSTTYNLNDDDELRKYLQSANSIGGLFSFMSVIIFRKVMWDNGVETLRYQFKNYAHVYNLLKILRSRKTSMKYIHKPHVLYRPFNDSFSQNGFTERILIDLNAYKLLQEHFFSDEPLKSAFLGVLCREHRWYHLLRLRSQSSSREWLILKKKLAEVNYSKLDLWLISKFGYFNFVVYVLRSIKKIVSFSP